MPAGRNLARLLAGVVAAGIGAASAQSPAPAVLANYEIHNGAIAQPLTGKPGDPKKGREVAAGRTLGNCLACHVVSALANEPFHGNVAPSLDGVAGRLSEGEIRLRLVDPTKVNPDSMMPPFYRIDGLNRVIMRFQGKPILTAEQIEDVIAFLETLK